MDAQPPVETYNPWTVVNMVFEHLADLGLHPTLGAGGHPGDAAAQLLRCLGITPDNQGDARVSADIQHTLAEMRARQSPES